MSKLPVDKFSFDMLDEFSFYIRSGVEIPAWQATSIIQHNSKDFEIKLAEVESQVIEEKEEEKDKDQDMEKKEDSDTESTSQSSDNDTQLTAPTSPTHQQQSNAVPQEIDNEAQQASAEDTEDSAEGDEEFDNMYYGNGVIPNGKPPGTQGATEDDGAGPPGGPTHTNDPFVNTVPRDLDISTPDSPPPEHFEPDPFEPPPPPPEPPEPECCILGQEIEADIQFFEEGDIQEDNIEIQDVELLYNSCEGETWIDIQVSYNQAATCEGPINFDFTQDASGSSILRIDNMTFNYIGSSQGEESVIEFSFDIFTLEGFPGSGTITLNEAGEDPYGLNCDIVIEGIGYLNQNQDGLVTPTFDTSDNGDDFTSFADYLTNQDGHETLYASDTQGNFYSLDLINETFAPLDGVPGPGLPGQEGPLVDTYRIDIPPDFGLNCEDGCTIESFVRSPVDCPDSTTAIDTSGLTFTDNDSSIDEYNWEFNMTNGIPSLSFSAVTSQNDGSDTWTGEFTLENADLFINCENPIVSVGRWRLQDEGPPSYETNYNYDVTPFSTIDTGIEFLEFVLGGPIDETNTGVAFQDSQGNVYDLDWSRSGNMFSGTFAPIIGSPTAVESINLASNGYDNTQTFVEDLLRAGEFYDCNDECYTVPQEICTEEEFILDTSNITFTSTGTYLDNFAVSFEFDENGVPNLKVSFDYFENGMPFGGTEFNFSADVEDYGFTCDCYIDTVGVLTPEGDFITQFEFPEGDGTWESYFRDTVLDGENVGARIAFQDCEGNVYTIDGDTVDFHSLDGEFSFNEVSGEFAIIGPKPNDNIADYELVRCDCEIEIPLEGKVEITQYDDPGGFDADITLDDFSLTFKGSSGDITQSMLILDTTWTFEGSEVSYTQTLNFDPNGGDIGPSCLCPIEELSLYEGPVTFNLNSFFISPDTPQELQESLAFLSDQFFEELIVNDGYLTDCEGRIYDAPPSEGPRGTFELAEMVTPIVVDLDSSGLDLMHYTESNIMYDVTRDGLPEPTSWVGPMDAILVYDKNGDGMVNDASEFVLTDYAPEANTDLEAMQQFFDSNMDNLFDINDDLFDSFALWQDSNQNGISEEGELVSLEEAGIESFDLEGYGEQDVVNGNVVHAKLSVNKTDGSTLEAGDVGLSFDAVLSSDSANELQIPPLAAQQPAEVAELAAQTTHNNELA